MWLLAALVLVLAALGCLPSQAVALSSSQYNHLQLQEGFDFYWRLHLQPDRFPLLVDGQLEAHLVSTGDNWFGLGICRPTQVKVPNLMTNCDITLVIPSQSSITDRFSPGPGLPSLDTQPNIGGNSSFLNASIVVEGDNSTHAEFWRLLDTGDTAGDTVIDFQDLLVIWTKSLEKLPTLMPLSRGSHRVNFISGVIDRPINSTNTTSGAADVWRVVSLNMKFLHGAFMGVTWGVVNVIGAGIARYFRHKRWWLSTHRLIQTIGTTGTFSMVLAALTLVENRIEAIIHASIGILIALLTGFQVFLGSMVIQIFLKKNQKYLLYIRKAHIYNGTLLLLLSVIQIYFGLVQLTEDRRWFALYGSWFGLVLVGVVFMEFHRAKRTKQIKERARKKRQEAIRMAEAAEKREAEAARKEEEIHAEEEAGLPTPELPSSKDDPFGEGLPPGVVRDEDHFDTRKLEKKKSKASIIVRSLENMVMERRSEDALQSSRKSSLASSPTSPRVHASSSTASFRDDS